MNLSRNLVAVLLLISVISCRNSNKSANKITLINEVVKECILQDSLFVTDTIINRFAYYETYELKYTDDGLEVPSKDWYYVNVDNLIKEIGNQELFNSEKDKSFLESQLSNSKKFRAKYKLSKYTEVTKKIKPKQFYIFYIYCSLYKIQLY